jgi:hypothetical protein
VIAGIDDLLEQYNAIVIYGAGKIGERVWQVLKLSDKNYIDHVVCFATTNPSPIEELRSIPIKPIHSIIPEYKDALFILAVSEKYINDLKDTIRKLRIDNYIEGIAVLESLTKHVQIDAKEMFMQQNSWNEYSRLDIIVRYLAIEEFHGGNSYGWGLYSKMQMERLGSECLENTVTKFKELIISWEEKGYLISSEIECDTNLNLIDGSHRLALCLYYNEKNISCKVVPYDVSTQYDLKWFLEHDFSLEEIKKIKDKTDELIKVVNTPFSCVLWPPVEPYFDEITEKIRLLYPIVDYKDYTFSDEIFEKAVKGIYYLDDIEKWKLKNKIENMKVYPYRKIRILQFLMNFPDFRLKVINDCTISSEAEKIKSIIRNCYSKKIQFYFYDIIIHISDNFKQSRYIQTLLSPAFSLEKYFCEIVSYNWMVIKLKSEYLPVDFPLSYTFSKDIDIICSRNDFHDLAKFTKKHFQNTCPKRCQIRAIWEKERFCLRIEQEGYLIFLVDIQTYFNEMSMTYVENALLRKKKQSVYYVPCLDDELCFRFYEFIKYPQKERHKKFIISNLKSLSCERLEEAFDGFQLEWKKTLTEIIQEKQIM